MKKVHVLTPFSRYEEKKKFVEYLSQFRDVIYFHPIELEVKSDWGKKNKNWIFPLCLPRHNEAWDYCYEKLNYFIEQKEIIDDDYYCFLNDDDGIEDSYFDEILNCDTDIVFASMKRGNHQVGEHPTTTLIASAKNIGLCLTGLEQIIVKGHVLREVRFNNHIWADGQLADYLNMSQHSKTYLSNTFALFNYFQKGRW